MVKISEQEIEHINQLARIKLNPNEIEQYDQELVSILDYVKELENAPTKDCQGISQISDLKNIGRADKVQESLPVEKVLQNAPVAQDNFIRVKKVFE